MLKANDFIEAWESAPTLRSAAEAAGMTYGRARDYSMRLRAMGFELKQFEQTAVDSHDNSVAEADYEPPMEVPSHPTNAAPGSKERIDLMQRRVAAGEPVWHPEDASFADCDRNTIRVF